jgi:benzodiazapine receptor
MLAVRHDWRSLLTFLALCLGVAGIGAGFTLPALEGWYAALRKPPWTPPIWVCGAVWTALYVSIAVAAWLVWRRRVTKRVTWPLIFFGVQLGLTVLWPGLFFRLQDLAAAYLTLVVLRGAVLVTVIAFWRVHLVAAGLLLPYFWWITFAAELNYALLCYFVSEEVGGGWPFLS